MSLFKSRVWWEINLNETDSFDSQCLLTMYLDNDQYQSIVLASHQGFLRIYSPSVKTIDDTNTNVFNYEASHLLLELRLPAPILQVNEGVLVSGSEQKQLAVLHPRTFSVYTLKMNLANGNKVGDQATMELAYQHVLRHSAQSFVVGSFGRVRSRQFISILSLDGLLSFYEQESFSFKVYMPDFLLSFNFIYLDKVDSFLFLNGFLALDCYSYESLASAEKKKVKSWEHKLGESVLDMQAVLQDNFVIIVLSERNLYGLNENGCMLFAKRLEYTPVAMCSYLTDEKKLMIVIAAKEKYLNLYEETRLKWCLKINQAAVGLKRIFLNQLQGGLVLLSENGLLQCIYIGTHPSVYFVSPLSQSEINPEIADSELKDLQLKIKNNDLTDILVCKHVVINTVKTYIQKPNRSCNLKIEIDVRTFVNTLQVLTHVEHPLVSENSTKLFTDCLGKILVESSVYLQGSEIPSSLVVTVIVTYVTSEGIGGCVTNKQFLPLNFVMEEAQPLKDSRHKFTFAINKPIIGMSHLFKEHMTFDAAATAVGVKHLSTQDVVTFLAAKSTQRYRVQSDSLSAITLPLVDIVEKLKQHFQKSGDLQVTHCTPLPLEPYYNSVRLHHALITKKRSLEEKLIKECNQYCTIQKKILKIFQDSSSKSSSNHYKLLDDTSTMILLTLNELEDNEKELVNSRSCLTSLNRLVTFLLELTNIPENNVQLLRKFLCPLVCDTDDLGWLEVQEAIGLHVLRSFLTKVVHYEDRKYSEINVEPMKDTGKLIKHLSGVIDKIVKSSRFSVDSDCHVHESKAEKEIISSEMKLKNFEESENEDYKSNSNKTEHFSSNLKNLKFKEEKIKGIETEEDAAKILEDENDYAPLAFDDEKVENNDDDESIWNVKSDKNLM